MKNSKGSFNYFRCIERWEFSFFFKNIIIYFVFVVMFAIIIFTLGWKNSVSWKTVKVLVKQMGVVMKCSFQEWKKLLDNQF